MTFEELLAEGKFNRPAIETVIGLIFFYNNYLVPKDKAVFGKPKALDQRPDINDDPNTFISLVLDQEYDARFISNDGFMYRRFELSRLTPDSDVDLNVYSLPFQVHDLLPFINSKLGVTFTAADILNEEFTEVPATITLRAAPDSLLWIGGSVEMDLVDYTQGDLYLRVTEEGALRLTEDGVTRLLEAAPPV